MADARCRAGDELEHEATRDRAAGCCTCTLDADGRSSWSFFGLRPPTPPAHTAALPAWQRRYSRSSGYHLVARRAVRQGETVVDEAHVLSAIAPSHNEPGWASASLRALTTMAQDGSANEAELHEFREAYRLAASVLVAAGLASVEPVTEEAPAAAAKGDEWMLTKDPEADAGDAADAGYEDEGFEAD